MPKFDTIKPGDVLYDVRRAKMGNTTMSEWSCWDVRVISVDADARTAVVSWNGNREETYRERRLATLKRSIPKCVREQQERYRRRGW